MSDFRIDQITNQAGTAGPNIAGITTFNTSSGVLLPSGNTEYRGGRGRGVWGGGSTPTNVNTIDYVTISTTGNALDFGDQYQGRNSQSSFSSSTRGIFSGGDNPINTNVNTIDYITISSTGNSFDFGDLSVAKRYPTGLSNSIIGLTIGGFTSTAVNTIEFILISSLGNSSFFGELTNPNYAGATCASSTRGVNAGGVSLIPSPAIVNAIDYISISSKGNSQDFGDLTEARYVFSGCSNSTRGIFGGGISPINTIDYITISTLGNAIDFGDLTVARSFSSSACASSTRGLFGGGGGTPSVTNTIDYVTILSTGNAIDFGDLTVVRTNTGSCSDAHGGLGD